mmetsp:Transcript_88867/g.287429  ORF Transcript_88867/g.287429 Transcript_88867/m.287429 type:complete len:115 (-) Transcript_88867:213-557(-)
MMRAVRFALVLAMLSPACGSFVKSSVNAVSGAPPSICAADCAPCADNCYEDCVAAKIMKDHTKDVQCKECVKAPNGCMNTEVAGCHKCVIGACQGTSMPADCPNTAAGAFLQRQ